MKTQLSRPRPEALQSFLPAPELLAWVESMILGKDGALHNPDHAHLLDADLAFLWAPAAFEKAGRMVLGQAEQVMFRAGGWQKARQEQQMVDWFGRVPAFLITLAADYCAVCSDAEFCALVEHELYHVGQAKDPFAGRRSTGKGARSCGLSGTTPRSSWVSCGDTVRPPRSRNLPPSRGKRPMCCD